MSVTAITEPKTRRAASAKQLAEASNHPVVAVPRDELVLVPPGDLVVDPARNVRVAAVPDAELVASIREHGVIQAIVAVREDDGTLVVHHGNRRAIAAVQAGLDLVSVIVRPKASGDVWALTQVDENDRRAPLTAADHTKAVQQLAAFGIPASEIAVRTKLPRAQVDAAFSINQLQADRPEVARVVEDLPASATVIEAAAIAEFADDPLAVDALTEEIGNEGAFSHALAQVRQDREDEVAVRTREDELRAAGAGVVDEEEWTKKKAVLVGNLRPIGSERYAALDEETHAGCPGGVVKVTVRTWARDGQDRLTNVHGCIQPHLHARYGRDEALTPEQEAAKADADAAAKLADSAWAAATGVRVDWIARLLTRKTLPAGGEQHLALLVTESLSFGLSGYQAKKQLEEIRGPGAIPVADLPAGRAIAYAFVLLLLAEEQSIVRRPTGHHRFAARHLGWLQAAGYPLSRVEADVLHGTTPIETVAVEGDQL